jgi:putative transposase
LTVIEDDYSRCIAGYFLSFDHPSIYHTALTLRQAIWRKQEPNWPICGIPEIFYTDNGGDFTSRHMEQVSADLKMRLVFSIPGMPRGRGRVERFFLTVNQLLLHKLPGYKPKTTPVTPPQLTLPVFEMQFKDFLLNEYHLRKQKAFTKTPQDRWEADGFLPQMPESLQQLDLMLLTVATTRRIRRDGIQFQNLRYMDVTLAPFVGEDVVIRYDPRDMAEIYVYYGEEFLCRAVCQDIADRTVSLQEIIRARNRQRRALRKTIKDRSSLIQTYLDVHKPKPIVPESETESKEKPSFRRLKSYYND